MKPKEIKDRILKEYQKGNVVVAGIEGLRVIPLDQIIKQPADGILYDLNRSEAVVLGFISDHKWVNDYAVSQVIRALKSKGIELLEDIDNFLIQLEDTLHGKEGNDVTELRAKIKKHLSNK